MAPRWGGPDFTKSRLFFHNSAAKPNYNKSQKTGRLFSRKYEFGTLAWTRILANPKS